MSNPRSLRRVIPAQKVNMGGAIIDQPLPTEGIDHIDPFLLIHHWSGVILSDRHPRDVGVGPHPHRGFSPVTLVFQGDVHHRDSLGNDSVVGPGGTQWMHAGRGITHSERPSAELAKQGGHQEIIQFWVNSPARHKMDPPYYQPITSDETPKTTLDDCTIAVIAGECLGMKGPAKTLTPQTILRVNAVADTKVSIPIPKTENTLLYVLKGRLKLDSELAFDKTMLWYHNDGDHVEVEVDNGSEFIILSGEPINEEVTTYGPFVMNTQTEILEAMRDAQQGKMGVLIEEF